MYWLEFRKSDLPTRPTAEPFAREYHDYTNPCCEGGGLADWCPGPNVDHVARGRGRS